MADILLSSDEDEVSQCVVRMPAELNPADARIVDCPSSRKRILQHTKFLQGCKIIEGRIPLTRWNLRKVVFHQEDPICLDCMQCVCPDYNCARCNFMNICFRNYQEI